MGSRKKPQPEIDLCQLFRLTGLVVVDAVGCRNNELLGDERAAAVRVKMSAFAKLDAGKAVRQSYY